MLNLSEEPCDFESVPQAIRDNAKASFKKHGLSPTLSSLQWLTQFRFGNTYHPNVLIYRTEFQGVHFEDMEII